jgi:hypothetical protein
MYYNTDMVEPTELILVCFKEASYIDNSPWNVYVSRKR